MRRVVVGILMALSFIMCLFFIQDSYAKYFSTANGNASMSIARWRILVNNLDIRNEASVDATISPVFAGNSNIASGIIAPTSTGYFDLIIDASMADVSFEYDIDISVHEDSSVQDLVATGYKINDGNVINFVDGIQSFNGTVLYSQNANPINIRVFIMWDDGVNASMSNAQDTAATTDPDNSALMNVSISFTQVAN